MDQQWLGAPEDVVAPSRLAAAMLRQLRPNLRDVHRSAGRIAELEHCRRLRGSGCRDQTGHATGVSGMIITERLGPYSFGADPGSWTDWQVVGERVLDSNGTHSWSLLSSDISLDAHWFPSRTLSVRGLSFSMDFAARTPAGAIATPESSTWAMMLIGFAGLGLAGYRTSRRHRRSIHFPKGYVRDDVQFTATKISTVRTGAGTYLESPKQGPGKSRWRNEIDERCDRRIGP